MSLTPADQPSDDVDPKLLEILVCPLTKGPLEYDAEKQELISRSAKLAYPIRAGIPIMHANFGQRYGNVRCGGLFGAGCQTLLRRPGGDLGAGGEAEPRQDAADVAFHAAFADHQFFEISHAPESPACCGSRRRANIRLVVSAMTVRSRASRTSNRMKLPCDGK